MSNSNTTALGPNPGGYCLCGCGERAPLARDNDATKGTVKGMPLRYVKGHQRRQWVPEPPNPSGLCMCGCGQITPIAKQTDINVPQVKDEHTRFCVGHKLPGPTDVPYREVDGGYSSDCWETDKGTLNEGGYRTASFNGVHWPIHRWTYTQKFGPIPEGLDLDHLCRNRWCCNPDHLEAVTPAVNTRRGAIAKLRPEDVAEIRSLAGTMSYRLLGERFGISASHAFHICKGNHWS